MLGALYEIGFLNLLSEISGPTIYATLGLPAVAGIALVLGILRKELTLQLLVALAVMQYGASAQPDSLHVSRSALRVCGCCHIIFPLRGNHECVRKGVGVEEHRGHYDR